MSTSNPFRRKQLAVLGLDNTSSDHFPGAQIQDRSGSRHRSPARLGRQDLASPAAHSDASESDDDARDTFAVNSVRDERGRQASWDHLFQAFPHSGLRSSSRDDVSPVDPFESEWIEEHSEEENELAQRARKHNDLENSWRSPKASSASAAGKEPSRDVPPKAQKTLGISSGRPLTEHDYRQKHSLSPETHNLAPKALRTLGLPSNPFQRPAPDQPGGPSHEEERPGATTKGIAATQRTPLDVDAFKRLLLTGDKDGSTSSPLPPHHPPLHGHPGDSGSNTDASSLSRHSIQDRETPRTSHETVVSEDEPKYADQAVSPLSERKNSYPWMPQPRPAPSRSMTEVPSAKPLFVDPASYLTEPFSHGPLAAPHVSAGHGALVVEPVELSAVADPVELPTDPPKIIPAPPTSRRQTPSRIRQLPDLASAILEESPTPPLPPSLQRTTSTKAPAPPPPRRSGNRASIVIDPPPNIPKPPPSSHPKSYQPPKAPPLPQLNPSPIPSPSLSTDATFFAPHVAPTTTTTTTTSIVNPPPLPPTRSASTTKRPSRLPPPTSSHSLLNAFPATPSSASIPPPAPPPRRHNSTSTYHPGRPSADLSTADQASLHAAAKAVAVDGRPVGLGLSWSSANAISKAAAAGERDVLADLGKLQREVDALRGGLESDVGATGAPKRDRAVSDELAREER